VGGCHLLLLCLPRVPPMFSQCMPPCTLHSPPIVGGGDKSGASFSFSFLESCIESNPSSDCMALGYHHPRCVFLLSASVSFEDKKH
jgi:hypothetical protein